MSALPPVGRGLSLWWLPPPSLSARLQGLIDALAGRLGTASFLPHVTVEAGIVDAPETVAAAIQGSAEARRAPVLRPTRLQTRPAWNHALRYDIEAEGDVREARTALCLALGRTVLPSAFQPHISLVYGELDEGLRTRLVETLQISVPSFQPIALALVDTEGPVTDWWEIQRWSLSGMT